MKKVVDSARALLKIKSAAGLQNAVKSVERFLTRKQIYVVLVRAVWEAEQNSGSLKVKIKCKATTEQFYFRGFGVEITASTNEAVKSLQTSRKTI